MFKKIKILLFSTLFICCSSINKQSLDLYNTNFNKNWYYKDYALDSILGISLDKWYLENRRKETNNEIIVAVLDTQIDLNQEDLQGQLWINKKEIPNNGIDDDNNGYIDDINGWNFVGKPNGGYLIYGNFEYVRVIQKWDTIFKDKEELQISKDLKSEYSNYKHAKEYLKYYINYYSNLMKSIDFNLNVFEESKDTLKRFFPNEDYSLSDLDSLYNLKKINDKPFWQRRNDNDKDLGALIDYMRVCYQNNEKTLEDVIYSKSQMDSILEQNLNVNFIDRKFFKDNPEILEKGYGNNIVNSFKKLQDHSTEVSSVIAGNRINNKGTKGFHQNIKIMPLVTSISGDEHDKDIAMAIYYAVDNGAKVINMSFGKEFSLKQEWVTQAIKYAESKDVLIIHCSGNNSNDLDAYSYYPNDVNYGESEEFASNFINVGGFSKRTNNFFLYKRSNYGKQNVDIFAPGEEIYVAIPDNQYKYDTGTSLAAPMVSGTAALIWLYYPNLTVQELKNIILESGVVIDKMVIKPGTKDELIHFSELCKTGKILNTYNAMKMAEKLSKNKK
ncbi:S8 family serine peptidase [uncultured Flavobacterium sp.]|uniref:S8 family serine peptidase n=1 Tax=uncultured Flavobacterium sp. TaxID=165435 RepID=UPI0030C7CE79